MSSISSRFIFINDRHRVGAYQAQTPFEIWTHCFLCDEASAAMQVHCFAA